MKKYYAETMPEAMLQIRKELGDDAVILNQRIVKTKKFLGLMTKKSFEVTAGVDEEVTVLFDKKAALPTAVVPQPRQQAPQAATVQTDDLRNEIADLKAMIQSMSRQKDRTEYPQELIDLLQYLNRQELDDELITVIGDELFLHLQAKQLSKEALRHEAKRILVRKLQALPFGSFAEEKRYIQLIGPTGVGKTTSIAKMAARTVLEQKKKVAFVTTDTYRIAAIEQLKTYAGLLQAPVEIVYSVTEYEAALKKLSSYDVIFIDTAGRNYKEARYVEEITHLMPATQQLECYLVLSATAKQQDMSDIIEQFKAIPFDKFVFTKLDETNSIGTIINLMIKYNKGLAYYTSGQEVPEDIEQASAEEIVTLLFQGEQA